MNPITPPLPPRHHSEGTSLPHLSFSEACEQIEKKCGRVSITERHGKGQSKVIILPEAFQELKVMISYGRMSPMNIKEQKFAGFGHLFADKNGFSVTVVSHFIQIHTMNRNPVGASNLGPHGEWNPGLDFLEYYREEFLECEKKFNTDAYGNVVDPFLDHSGSEFVLEGHTHPNLGVFYSNTDRVSGKARAGNLPICIFVCDPIKKEMLGSIGRDFDAAEVIVYDWTPVAVFSERRPEEVRRIVPSERRPEEVRRNAPTDEILKITIQCLKEKVYTGRLNVHSQPKGRTTLRIRIKTAAPIGDLARLSGQSPYKKAFKLRYLSKGRVFLRVKIVLPKKARR